jgi:hypothetical protein
MKPGVQDFGMDVTVGQDYDIAFVNKILESVGCHFAKDGFE